LFAVWWILALNEHVRERLCALPARLDILSATLATVDGSREGAGMTWYGAHAGTEDSSLDDVLAYWRTVESLGFGWISVWLKERFGTYAYTGVAGATLFGSDERVLDGIKAFEQAGADQILFAGAFREDAEQLERVAALVGI
jgi:hypothetical protein